MHAIFLGLAAFAVWGLCDVGTKLVGKASVPFLQIVCLSCIGAISFLFIVCLIRGELDKLKPRNLKLQLPQGFVTLFQSLICVITFTQLPLSTVYAALFASPMIAAIMANLILKESLEKKQFFYIAVGFIGSLIAVNPFSADLSGGSALGWILLPVYPLFFAVSSLIIRKLQKTETKESTAFFPSFFRLIVFLPIALFNWQPMELSQIIIMLASGSLMALGNLFFNAAFSRAAPAIVSPTHYSQLIWGAVFGFAFFGDLPTWYAVAGSIIIVATGFAGARLAMHKAPIVAIAPDSNR